MDTEKLLKKYGKYLGMPEFTEALSSSLDLIPYLTDEEKEEARRGVESLSHLASQVKHFDEHKEAKVDLLAAIETLEDLIKELATSDADQGEIQKTTRALLSEIEDGLMSLADKGAINSAFAKSTMDEIDGDLTAKAFDKTKNLRGIKFALIGLKHRLKVKK